MKNILMLVLMTLSNFASAQSTQATTVRKTFSRTTSVSTVINADPAVIWALLTNAADYPRWNSTVLAMEGNIAPGEKIQLKSTLDPKRNFKLKVQAFEPEKHLAWGDGKGTRSYTLTQQGHGTVAFSMVEKIGGLMFPMYAKYIPPFDAAFDQFAADLKKEAEIIQHRKQ